MNTHSEFAVGVTQEQGTPMINVSLKGKLTHEDYETAMPQLDAAFGQMPNGETRMLIDATEFEGLTLHAMWDDLKNGFTHAGDLDKVALYGNSDAQKNASKVADFMSPGHIEYFDDREKAVLWLKN